MALFTKNKADVIKNDNDSIDIGQELVVQKAINVDTTAAGTLISSARKRTSIYIRNISTGASRISIQFSNVDVPVDNTGFVLNQNEFLIDSNSEGYKCWSGKITAICSDANGVLSVVER